MDVSVIIVNWNTRQITCDCLHSVYRETTAVDFEVIVVDNGSTDGSVEAIQKEFPQVCLIANQDNRGFAAANNQGMVLARGRYILLLNSDTLVLDGAIQKMVRFADQNPDTGVLGCRVLNRDRTLQRTCFMYPSLLNGLLEATYLNKLFPRSRFWAREGMGWWNRDDVRDVEVVTGCFMLVRSESLKQVGLMDERFYMYAEESDWCYRFKQSGWRVLFTPEAQIIHLGGQSSAMRSGEMIIQLRLSILKFVRKHHGWLACRIMGLITAFFFALRVPLWFCVGLLSPSRRGQALIRGRAYLRGAVATARCRI